jgi:hypothetical protein
MFESDLDKDARKRQRRTFLAVSAAAAVGAMALGSMRRPGIIAAAVESLPGETTGSRGSTFNSHFTAADVGG